MVLRHAALEGVARGNVAKKPIKTNLAALRSNNNDGALLTFFKSGGMALLPNLTAGMGPVAPQRFAASVFGTLSVRPNELASC
jgi:hypothetical protein